MEWNNPNTQAINYELFHKSATRIVKRFQWLPTTINGVAKWLEFVSVKQEMCETDTGAFGAYNSEYHWRDMEWVN